MMIGSEGALPNRPSGRCLVLNGEADLDQKGDTYLDHAFLTKLLLVRSHPFRSAMVLTRSFPVGYSCFALFM